MHVAVVFAALLVLIPGAARAASDPGDRLARFGELARSYAGALEAGDRVLPQLFAVVDDEILDSLRSGGPFASVPFIQERLDAFRDTWGGAAFHVLRVPGSGERAPLITVAVLTVTGAEPTGSLRVYGGTSRDASLLASATHEGALSIYPWPATRDGATQFLASWLGVASGRAARPLRLELWRRSHAGPVARSWSLAADDGPHVSELAVNRQRLMIRHEVRYPGWKTGCDGQTEYQDTYQPAPVSAIPVLTNRKVFEGWHRELQVSVTRFFSALSAGDQTTLAELVPDRALRARLPRGLVAEPACEQRAPGAPATAVVAATEPLPPGTPRPWSLSWTRGPRGWRLSHAAPVLQ